VIPGHWQKVAALPPDSHIVVALYSAERIECSYQSLTNVDLVVDDLSGSELRISRLDIVKVTSADPVRDSLWNGPLIGLGIGAGAGALLGAVSHREEGFEIFSRGDEALIGAVVGGVVGATVGLVTDVVKKKPDVLYVALSDASE
jgi:hypothetical protein